MAISTESGTSGGREPRLPRGGGGWLRGPQLIKIGATATLLVVVIVLRKPCSEATSKFVSDFDGSDARLAETLVPVPAEDQAKAIDALGGSELIPLAGKTEAEIAAAIAAARAKAAGSGSGSGPASGFGSGSGLGSGSGSGSGFGSGSGSGSGRL